MAVSSQGGGGGHFNSFRVKGAAGGGERPKRASVQRAKRWAAFETALIFLFRISFYQEKEIRRGSYNKLIDTKIYL